MKTLDRTRPYGVVYGDLNVGYEQDGLQFNNQGFQVGAAPEPEPPPQEQKLKVVKQPEALPEIDHAALLKALHVGVK